MFHSLGETFTHAHTRSTHARTYDTYIGVRKTDKRGSIRERCFPRLNILAIVLCSKDRRSITPIVDLDEHLFPVPYRRQAAKF